MLDLPTLKKIAQQRQLQRRAALSKAIPTPDSFSTKSSRDQQKRAIEIFLSQFDQIYTKLLNDVRANLPQELDPVLKELGAISSILEMDEKTVTENSEELLATLRTKSIAVTSAANQSLRLLRTIVQLTNQLSSLLK